MMRSMLTILMGAVVAVGVVGCGGGATTKSGDTASGTPAGASATLVAHIETICAQRNTAIATDGEHITRESPVERVTHNRAVAEQTALRQLEGMTVPSALQLAWRQFLAAKRALIKDWDEVSENGLTARRGAAFASAQEIQDQMLAAARRLGLKECAQLE
jgi:ABC-type branched-subunit amino acid transport system ATPase component